MQKEVIGVRFICILMLFPIIATLVGGSTATLLLSLPDAKKFDAIQRKGAKSLNLGSIEEYNKFWKVKQAMLFSPLTILNEVLLLVSIMGLWAFKKWGRSAFFLFAILNILVLLSSIILKTPGIRPIVSIFNMVLLAALICYLTLPEISKQFK
jgi:hypothetical protein